MNNYFSHDSNARNSDKLIPLRMRWGAEGYGIYFMILERLREEPGYMSVKDYNMIAFDLRVDTGKVKSIVEDFGLFVFTEDGKYFYSESFKRRMTQKDEKSKKLSEAGKIGNMKRWSKNNASTATQSPPDRICDKNLSQEKKSKEKKEYTPYNPPKGNCKFEIEFEKFRKLYPGVKRGLSTEFGNLKTKHKDWESVIPMLSNAIINEINFHKRKSENGEFVPQYKHLSTWINNRCWEQEFEKEVKNETGSESTTIYRRGHKSAQSN